MKKFCVVVLFLILFNFLSAKELRINEVSVLISYHSKGRILEVSGEECVLWSTTDPNLLKISHLDQENREIKNTRCSKKIRVHPINVFSSRKSGMIFAQSTETGKTVQCEVFVDLIETIQILTTVRKLVVGELETLEVQAFDSEGNVFSSLDGLNFNWKTSSVNGGNGAIELLSIDDKTVNIELRQELTGIKDAFSSNYIIAKGLKVGQAVVSAHLNDIFSKNLSNEVNFSVLDKFVLEPSSLLRVVPGAIVPYKLKKGVENTLELVPMPNKQFTWKLSDTGIAEVDQIGVMKAHKYGTTQIIVHDNHFTMNEAKGLIMIVKPAYLKFKIEQISPKFSDAFKETLFFKSNLIPEGESLIEEHDYKVTVEMYDQQDNLIYVTDHTKYLISLSGNGEISKLSSNQRTFNLKAMKIGEIQLNAKLEKGPKDIFGELTKNQILKIHSKVKIEYKLDTIHLPVDEGIQQSYQVVASGGSGRYVWFGENSQVIKISNSGVITTLSEGNGDVFVVDAINFLNGDFRIVSVSIAASIHFVKGLRETSVHSDLCLGVIVRNSRGNAFANFSALDLSWSITDPSIYSKTDQKDCKNRFYSFRAVSVGFTAVRVMLKKGKIQDKVFIAAFPPLEIVSPKSEILVSFGSKIEINIYGGPMHWSKEYGSVIKYSTLPEHPDRILFEPIHESEKNRKYAVTCKGFGTQKIKFIVDHSTSILGFIPTKVSVTAIYHCLEPHSVKIVPLNFVNGQELTPLPVSGVSKQVYNIKNNQTLPIQMKVYDVNGVQFDDISSFDIKWKFTETRIAKRSEIPDEVGKTHLDISDEEGFLFLKGSIVGYLPTVYYPPKLKIIDAEIELRITSNLFLNPSFYLLFKSSKVSCTLTAGGGSGKYKFSSNDTQISTLNPSTTNNVVVHGIQEGFVGVQVTDSQFTSSVLSVVKISDLYYVKIKGPRLVKEGEEMTVYVVVSDDAENEFDPSQLFAMNPKIDINFNSIARVSPSNAYKNSFTVRGISAGVVKLVASVVNAQGERIYSIAFQVQVFSEMKVDPAKLLLIPGAEYQIAISGGPTEGNIITYYSLTTEISDTVNPTVATIDTHGVVTAVNYGSALIVIERVFEKETFAKIFVPLFVVKLHGIRAPETLTLYQGMCAPLTIIGDSNKGPIEQLYMQSPNFGASFYSENTNIATVTDSSTDSYEPVHSAIICANQVGKADVTIRSEFKHITLGLIRSTFTTNVFVEKKLSLTSCLSEVLLAPHSSYKLETNKNEYSNFKYSVPIIDETQLIELDQYGVVRSKKFEGTSSVSIEDVSDGQIIVVKVGVMQPNFLAIESLKKITNQLSIPLGVVSNVKLIALNKMGEKLLSFNGIDVLEKKNYQNILQIQQDLNGKLKIKALKEGTTILEISSPYVQHSFYVRVTVFGAIKPVNPYLIIGDKINFFTVTYDTGKWTSLDEDILTFKNDGNAIALKEGKTKISFLSNEISTSTNVIVSKISSMSVVPSNEYFKTNEKLNIKINFFDSFGNEIISHPVGISRDLNIECGSMNPNFVVEKYIAVNNTCVLSPILSSAEFKQSQISIQLYAKVSIPELSEYIIESNPISLKVIQEAHDENPSKPSSIQPTTKKGYSFTTIVFSLILVAVGLYLFTSRRKKTEKKKKTFQYEDEEEEYGNFQEINFSANSAFTKVNRN